MQYDIYFRPLWTWCRELLANEALIGEFTWDAQQIFKYNGEHFERFIDEPWTADAWWQFQVSACLPNRRLLMPFIYRTGSLCTESRSVLSFTPIKPVFHHLELQKDTPFSLGVQICQ